MSVSSVTNATTSSTSTTSSLTDAQKKTISSLLKDYDENDFTTTDSASLISAIGKAGITVNSDVISYLKKQGFDVLNASESSSSISDILNGSNSSTSSVSSLLEQYKNGDITEDELRAELVAQMPTYYSVLNGNSSSSTGSLLNVTA